MIKVLIVDDDPIRPRKIASAIKDENVETKHVLTYNDALLEMRRNNYDFAIIDIVLPKNIETIELDKNAGISILNDIKSIKKINPPSNIVFITGDEEKYNEYQTELDKELIPFLFIDTLNESWTKKLKSKIDYIVNTNLDTTQQLNEKIDIAIITAVEDEVHALKDEMSNMKLISFEDDPTSYYVSNFETNDCTKKILFVKLPQMGMVSAANATTKIINHFNPDKIYMIGICGGIEENVNLGDLVIAESSWDYFSGKVKPKQDDGKSYYSFEPEPQPILINAETKDKMNNCANDVFSRVVQKWNNENKHDKISPQLHIGPMPSGPSVIADKQLYNEIIKPQHRKCCAIDMETYGVYYSIKYSTKKQVEFLSMKGVSDYADINKNDDYHTKCCFLSTNFLLDCIKSGIL